MTKKKKFITVYVVELRKTFSTREAAERFEKQVWDALPTGLVSIKEEYLDEHMDKIARKPK